MEVNLTAQFGYGFAQTHFKITSVAAVVIGLLIVWFQLHDEVSEVYQVVVSNKLSFGEWYFLVWKELLGVFVKIVSGT